MAQPFLTAHDQLLEIAAPVLLHCATTWGEPGLPGRVTLAISHRMRRSLGRCYALRRLVRIAPVVLELPPTLQEEVVCHEAAHLVVFERHDRTQPPHGSAWRELMRAVGVPARLGLPITADAALLAASNPTPGLYYEHRCPVCQRARAAWWEMTRWRCPDCVAAGLEGMPVITPRAEGKLGF